MFTRLLLPALTAAALGALPQDAIDVELLGTYFATCDADANGWLSYRECRDSLALDREAYASFDTNADFRVSREEFDKSYVEVTRRIGGLLVPQAVTERKVDLPRGPAQLLAVYDLDGDDALQTSELMQLFDDYGLEKVPVETAMGNLDDNSDNSLSGVELERAARLLQSLYASGILGGNGELPSYASVDELFGKTVERPAAIDASRQPPLIVGPVLTFRRLDLDGDGGIEIDDLYRLLTPVTPSFSIGAIHAGLDLNEDGRIDRAELAVAFGLGPAER